MLKIMRGEHLGISEEKQRVTLGILDAHHCVYARGAHLGVLREEEYYDCRDCWAST